MKKSGVTDSWKTYGQKLESEIQIDLNQLARTKQAKTRKELNRFIIWRMIESALFTLCFWLLLRFTLSNVGVLHYMLAGVTLGVFTIIGLARGIWQVILIFRLNYSIPVTLFQEQLEKVKAYNLQTLRLLLLSIPFYFSYIIIGSKAFFNFDILSHADSTWLWINLALSILFIRPAVWLYKHLNYKTKIGWLKSMIMDNGGKQLRSAIQFLDEIEQFKAND